MQFAHWAGMQKKFFKTSFYFVSLEQDHKSFLCQTGKESAIKNFLWLSLSWLPEHMNGPKIIYNVGDFSKFV